MSVVDIFDRTKRYEDLVDTYTVDAVTGKRVPDLPVKLPPRSPEVADAEEADDER
jgi:hypothetical protein